MLADAARAEGNSGRGRGVGRGGGRGVGRGGARGGPTSVLYVRQIHVGKVIGKGGSTIKAITAKSGAKIDIKRDAKDGKIPITVTGSQDMIKSVRMQIEKITGENTN